ncbi:hypothetical protein [Nannocystis pusilla]|uniref:hypothetical protein n=1 Tax=Nannocystis pusilla TaxID=889268 RepID=UPI003B826302
MPFAFASFALVASLLGTGPAPGGASDRIAVVGDADDEAIVRQLRAELSALGFEVLAPEAPAEDDDESWADDLGAVAAIRVVEHEALEIRIVDRVAGKSVRHRVAIPQPHTEEDARIVAMRAIELLRASLREPQEAPVVSPPPPKPSPPSTPSTPSPTRPAARASSSISLRRWPVAPAASAHRFMPCSGCAGCRIGTWG